MSFLRELHKYADYMSRGVERTESGVERVEEPTKNETHEYRDDQQALRGAYLVVRPRKRRGDAENLTDSAVRPEQVQTPSWRRFSGA